MEMSQREAARQWGLSRAYIQRAIKSGKVSTTRDGKIEVSEMVRAFGEPKPTTEPPKSGSAEPLGAPPEPGEGTANLADLADLKALLASRDREIELLQKNLDDLRGVVRLLSHEKAAQATPEPPKPRRWWPF
jgi:hypothetical protein